MLLFLLKLSLIWLSAKVRFFVLGTAEQQINIMAIQNQVFPIVVLSDQIDISGDERIDIPATALVSIVPIAATAMQGVIDAGKAEEILQSLSLKSC